MESSDGSSRDTSVLVVLLETSEAYVIISLSRKKDTQVIYIDPTTGSLRYLAKPGLDLFNSEEEALNYITDGSRLMCKTTTYARAILGYAALGNLGLLLVATRLSATVPNLPGGGCVYTVTESQWIKIQLQNPQPQGKGELKNVQELTELDIDGKHYFCETRDITRPFPSPMTSQNPDDEFVWNGWFSKPFIDIGLPKHCVTLLQGFAECRNIGGSGQGSTVALLARRSRFHPGTRYLARGLNSCSGTGNEVECEQLVWIPSGQTIPFSSYIWRRGTIPIWWGAELKLSAVEAEIYVSAQNPYRGSAEYYQRLSSRYAAKDPKLSTVGQKKTPLVPIICVNLLRYGEGKPETILVDHFKESLKYIKSTGKLPYTWIQLINYDWHATVKSKGEQQTVEGLWKLLKAPTIAIGFCEGNYFSSVKRLKECKGLVICSDDFDGGFCLRSLQNGVIRFNCADSLDRTNAASYFGSLQVFVEQCRRLGISLDRDPTFGISSKYGELGNYGGKSGSLPPGWEERSDAVTGKSYYIDHNTRRTTWEHPCPDKPWKRFDMSFDQFKSSTILPPINQLADLFLLAGDIHATIYTGSKAMHSQILNIFSDDGGGKYSRFSVAQNVKITLQRRYQNVLVDSSRQKQLEMFLGIRLFKHLPSVPVHPLKVLSRPSGCLLKPIPSILPIADGGSSLLSFKRKDLVWVCPPAADVVELFIYLGEPCHVSHLLLTVSHGVEDSSYPATVDVRTGSDLDGLRLVLEGACIPQCSNGTNLLIPLTGRIDPEDMAITGNSARLHSQEDSYLPLLYNFEELEGEINFLTRIVALTFYHSVPGRTPLTLGEIEVLGVSLPWMDIFAKNMNGAKFITYSRETHKCSTAIHRASDINNSTNASLRDSNASRSHDAFSSSSVVQSAQPSAVSHGIDLLTGDLLFSDSSSQPDRSSVAEDTVPSNEWIVDCFDTKQFAGASSLPDQACGGNNIDDSIGQCYIDLFKSFSTSNRVACWMMAGERQATRIRNLYLKTILRQDISFFDNETTSGQVIGRMSGDTILIQDATGEKVGKFIQLVSTFVGGFVISYVRGWLLSLVMMSCIPPIVIAGAAMAITIAKLSTRGQKAYAEAGTVVEQTIGSVRTVVSFTGEKQAIDKYNKHIKSAYKSVVHEGTAAGLGIGCVLLIVFGSYGLAIWFGSKLIISKGYNGGTVINVMMAILTGGMSLGQASPCLKTFASGQAAAYKMFETINRKPEIDVYDTSGIILDDLKGDVELKDVYFSYPSRPEQLIFDGFSLYVPSGRTMALVGESSSRKSTVIGLVERFYDPTSGQVLIDGVDLKKLRLRWIREKIGLVSQEPVLFTTTIRENIAYGKDGATDAKIRRATVLANAAKFIDKMPNGLDTMVGEHGTQLSGGQKQRIAISRAILKNPKILLLDEATSALDTESEKVVQDALLRIMVDRTTIVVAHRHSTVKDADTISVVQRGKLIEQGSHAELVKDPDGAYSQLIRLQEIDKQEQAQGAPPGEPGNREVSFAVARSAGRSSSGRISLNKSVSRASSAGGSPSHSFAISLGLPGATTFQDGEDIDEGVKMAKKPVVPLSGLASLNKPELPLILIGAVAAALNRVILPIFGVLLSSAIKIFYEPPHELKKDSEFWALMFLLLGIASLILVPVQNFLFGMAGGKLVQRIRSLSFQKVVHQEIGWFDEPANSRNQEIM